MGSTDRKHKGSGSDALSGWALIRSVEGAGFIDKHVAHKDSQFMTRLADVGIGSYRLRFELEVHLDDGRPPYMVVDEFKVPREAPNGIHAGLRVPLRADAADPSRLELDWAAFQAPGGDGEQLGWGSADQVRGHVHQSLADGTRSMMVDGWVRAVQAGLMTRSAFEQAISGAVSGGLLTTAEADVARRSAG